MKFNRYTLTTAASDACNSLEGIASYSEADVVFVQEANHFFRFFSTSTLTPNGSTIIAPGDVTAPDPGRWIRQGAPGPLISPPAAFACAAPFGSPLYTARWIKPTGTQATSSTTAVDFPGAVLTVPGLKENQQILGELRGNCSTSSGGAGIRSFFQMVSDFGAGDAILGTDIHNVPDPAADVMYRRVVASGVLTVPAGVTSVTTRVQWSTSGGIGGVSIGDIEVYSLELKIMLLPAGSVIST